MKIKWRTETGEGSQALVSDTAGYSMPDLKKEDGAVLYVKPAGAPSIGDYCLLWLSRF
jgi:hypothetical protein